MMNDINARQVGTKNRIGGVLLFGYLVFIVISWERQWKLGSSYGRQLFLVLWMGTRKQSWKPVYSRSVNR